ncbi:proline racemase family protein [Pseudogracilibacillus auburnensis]|uniref:Proline racemase n=1 Tax=Pseudogracilibacillus auburnensis TaxID=1494959 RepID=A0A2V3VM34_9BACI|nr:proline racemase family protein [Pseudogracilibacillus auburnensis]MBO1002518.1 proline racemase family protein [Pseudogracilibacillus auburnensis]PXW82640.1 proline racemase [Pseudogracilibacillus auburnensis]
MIINKMYTTIDVHVAGEPLRIITDGLPEIKGKTQLERRLYCMEHLDHVREILMYEPRGHHGMYGCIITEPASEQADFGVLFMHNEGWSTMCGHGIIAVITMGIETGRFEITEEQQKFTIDTPAGEVVATAKVNGSKVESVSFENVPSFVLKKDVPLHIDGYELKVDIAFGGAFYAVVQVKDLQLKVNKRDLPSIQKWGTRIKRAVEKQMEVVHPSEKGLHGIYGVIFSDASVSEQADLRNVTIFADEQVDRSPCGTGTCARLATLLVDGKMKENDSFIHESITDGLFTGKITATSNVGNHIAVIPEITGQAFITGIHHFLVDPNDTLPKGFLLEEI